MKKCPECGRGYDDNATTVCAVDNTALEIIVDASTGETLAGKYRLEKTLSEESTATIYSATQLSTGSAVAVKVLHSALTIDEKIVNHFLNEAGRAASVTHPHLAGVIDFGTTESGRVFLSVEYPSGRSLKEVVSSEGPLPVMRSVAIIRQLCDALAAAHAKGIVHPDLRSGNVIVLDDDGSHDKAKLLNLEVAKFRPLSEPFGEPFGEPLPPRGAGWTTSAAVPYISPEQCIQTAKLDERSNIYSLGVILYEMLAGKVPFSDDSPAAVMLKHLQQQAPSVLEARRDVPRSIANAIQRAMAKQSSERYQTVDALAQDLSAAVAAEATVAGQGENEQQNSSEMVTGFDYFEEATIVYPKGTTAVATTTADNVISSTIEGESVGASAQPPTPASFRPWRIAVPAFIVLMVAFAVAYVVAQNSGQNPTDEPGALRSDPNSQPVLLVAPPSGESETNITPRAPIVPTIPSVTSDAGLPTGNSSRDSMDFPPLPPDLEELNATPNAGPSAGIGKKTPDNTEEDEAPTEPQTAPLPPDVTEDDSLTPPPAQTQRRRRPANPEPTPDDAPPPSSSSPAPRSDAPPPPRR